MGGILAKELASAGLKLDSSGASATAGRLCAARFDPFHSSRRSTGLGPARTHNHPQEIRRSRAPAISHKPAKCFGRRAASLDRASFALHAGRFQALYK